MRRSKLRVAFGTDSETTSYIVQSFEELFGRRLDFDIESDRSLLGGFVAEIDGCVFDSSLSSKLAEMKRTLLKG